MTLQVDESCWLRMLPQALTEADANSEIHRKGLCSHACLPLLYRLSEGGGVTWLCLAQHLKGHQAVWVTVNLTERAPRT